MAAGYKEVLPPETININSVATVYSNNVSLHRSDKVSFHFVYVDGAGTGTLQLTNDGTNWIDIVDTALALSGDDSAMWDIIDTAACAARIKFASGSTMTGSMYKCVR